MEMRTAAGTADNCMERGRNYGSGPKGGHHRMGRGAGDTWIISDLL